MSPVEHCKIASFFFFFYWKSTIKQLHKWIRKIEQPRKLHKAKVVSAASIATTIATVSCATDPQFSAWTCHNLQKTNKLMITYIHWARIMKIKCIFLDKKCHQTHKCNTYLKILHFSLEIKGMAAMFFCSTARIQKWNRKESAKILRGSNVKLLHFAPWTNIFMWDWVGVAGTTISQPEPRGQFMLLQLSPCNVLPIVSCC